MTKVTRYLLFFAVFLPAAAFVDFFAVFFAAAIVTDSFEVGAGNCADPLAPNMRGGFSGFTPLIRRSRLMT